MRTLQVFALAMALFEFTASSADATEVLWRHINLNHTYEDPSTSCSSIKPGGEFYFSAEVEQGKATKVSLSNYPYVFPYTFIYKNVQLSASEVAKIELFRDPRGHYWVKTLPLSGTLLRWILYQATEKYYLCPLPQPLSTIFPSSQVYEFEMEGVQEGILVSHSQSVKFSGQRSDGQYYKAKMGFVQREYRSWP